MQAQPTCLDVSMEHKLAVLGMDDGTVLATWLVPPKEAARTGSSERQGGRGARKPGGQRPTSSHRVSEGVRE